MKIIEVHIVVEGNELRVPLGRFRDLLKDEIGRIATVFKQSTFEQRFDTAIAKVIQKLMDANTS